MPAIEFCLDMTVLYIVPGRQFMSVQVGLFCTCVIFAPGSFKAFSRFCLNMALLYIVPGLKHRLFVYEWTFLLFL